MFLYRVKEKKEKVSVFHKEEKELEKSRQLKEHKKQARNFNLLFSL